MSAGHEEPPLSAGAVRQRATRGAMFVGLRGIIVRALGFVGLTVLAHYLSPRDFGVLAIGLSLTASVGLLTDAGLAAGFVRQAQVPVTDDLRAVMAFQLAVTVPLALLANAVALVIGHEAQVVALMMCAAPIVAFRTPGVVLLERRLDYQLLASVEVLETLTFTVGSIVAAAVGLGTMGVAGALILRSLVGTGLMVARGPAGALVPRWNWARLREPLKFGAKYQTIGVVSVFRDQGVNSGAVAFGAVATLGIWSVAYRLLQVPFLVFETLGRVLFPAIARLMDTGDDPRPTLERAVLQMMPLTGLLMAALVGTAGALIPLLFGAKFAPAADAVPFAALGLLALGPVSVCGANYLFAADQAGKVVVGLTVNAVVWVGLTIAFVSSLAAAGIGLAWMVSCLVEAALLVHWTAVRPLRLGLSMAPSLLLTLPAAGAGWAAADAVGPTVAGAAVGAAIPVLLYALLMFLFQRPQSAASVALVRRAVTDRKAPSATTARRPAPTGAGCED